MNGHVPVMLEEVMAILKPTDDAIYVDATFGGGGYSEALLSRARCTVYGIDRDPAAIRRGEALAARFPGRLTLLRGRFSKMEELLASVGVVQANGVALDLGVSSFQLGEPERGFSFGHDGPLDMRMDPQGGRTAADLVNGLPEAELARLLALYGEERRAKSLARAIVAARPLTRTRELAQIAERVLGVRGDRIHPATRAFQALRLAVNDELSELEGGLDACERILAEGGRLAVVSFQSLEDRIVKRFLVERSSRAPSSSRHAPALSKARRATFNPIGKSPQIPSAEEIEANPRARSAKLRGAVRTGAAAQGSRARSTGETA